MRGELLPLWQPGSDLGDAERAAWETPAYRMALGVELVAHLEPIVDSARL